METKDIEQAITNGVDPLVKSVAEVKTKQATVDQSIAEIQTELKSAAKSENIVEIKSKLADIESAVEKLDSRVKAVPLNPQNENKTIQDRIAEVIAEKNDDVQKFIKGETKKLVLEMKAVSHVGTGNVTGTNWGLQARPGIIMNQNTMTHVRSLLPMRPAGPGTDYYFMREDGAGEGSIAATSETIGGTAATTQATGLKPQFDLDLIEASVKFETIAGWMLMSKKALNNIPGFMGFLQARIPEKLYDVEDAEILYGSGTSPHLKGILTAGNFVASTASTANPLVERIIDDLSILEDTYKRLATGIVMRPADYYGFFKNKAAGSGEYDLPQGVVFVNGVLYILGIPVAKTTALTAGDYVVGDFVRGAELLIQEAIQLEFFREDGTNVRTNQITVRVEETVALPVYGSDYFIKGDSSES